MGRKPGYAVPQTTGTHEPFYREVQNRQSNYLDFNLPKNSCPELCTPGPLEPALNLTPESLWKHSQPQNIVELAGLFRFRATYPA